MLEQSSTVTWSRARHGTEWSKARHQRGARLDTDIVEHGSTLVWSMARHGQRLSTGTTRFAPASGQTPRNVGMFTC